MYLGVLLHCCAYGSSTRLACTLILRSPGSILCGCNHRGTVSSSSSSLAARRFVNQMHACSKTHVHSLSTSAISFLTTFETESMNSAPGQLPRTVDVIVEDDLVDSCKPGDRVAIVGIYKVLPGKNKGSMNGVFRTVLIANNVSLLNKEANAPIYSPDDFRIIAHHINPDYDHLDPLAIFSTKTSSRSNYVASVIHHRHKPPLTTTPAAPLPPYQQQPSPFTCKSSYTNLLRTISFQPANRRMMLKVKGVDEAELAMGRIEK